MSLHYILDGYNMIHQSDALARGSLEQQRDQLIRFLERNHLQGSVKNTLTVVFDGRSDVFSEHKPSSVKIIFSKDESADEKIKRIVAESSIKANVVVVTNDRDIQYSVRAYGAKAIGVEGFLRKQDNAQTSVSKNKERAFKEQKAIPKTLEFKITTELEKIWIKDSRKKQG